MIFILWVITYQSKFHHTYMYGWIKGWNDVWIDGPKWMHSWKNSMDCWNRRWIHAWTGHSWMDCGSHRWRNGGSEVLLNGSMDNWIDGIEPSMVP